MTAEIKMLSGSRSLVKGNELYIYGYIDAQAYEGEGVRAIDVINSLSEIKSNEISVRINSPGGSVTEGIAIYNTLRADGRKVTVYVDAIAASIASIIALAGDSIVMAENSQIMIHKPFSGVVGNAEEMRKMANTIDSVEDIIVGIYAKRTGKPETVIKAMMAAETYLSAAEAVELGFATSIDAPMKIAACLGEKSRLEKLIMSSIEAPIGGDEEENVEVAAEVTEAPVEEAEEEEEETEAPVEENIQAALGKERTRAAKIVAMVKNAGLDAAFASSLIEKGIAVSDANELVVNAYAAKNAPATGPEILNATVTRDEGETRNAGMEESLVARLSGVSNVSSNAARYMELPLYAMAAERVGFKGSLYNAAARENVIRMAVHTTSDFPVLLENAMNKALAGRYALQSPTYRALAQQRTYSDFRPHTTVRMGDFPQLQPVDEGGEIRSGSFSETKEMTQVKAYGVQVGFSRQLLVNDNLSGIQQVLASRADMVAQWEEAQFFKLLLSNSGNGPQLNETGRNMFNATDGNLSGTGTAIDVTELGKGRAAMRKFKTLDGLPINVSPSFILCGPDVETRAQQFVASITPNQNVSVNPFSGTLQVITSAQITGNAWYLVSPSIKNFEWGLLDGYTAPRFRMEEPFGQQGMKVSLEHDWGAGAIDFRGMFKNPGA